jgi:hypothetical protein
MFRDKSYSEGALAVASSASSSQAGFGETPIESVRDLLLISDPPDINGDAASLS